MSRSDEGQEGQFRGYRRDDGRVGIRNLVLVMSITGLTCPATRRIGSMVRNTHTICMPYNTGLLGQDKAVHLRTLEGLACNPNVGAVLLISDHVPKLEKMAAALRNRGQKVACLSMDDVGQDAIALVARGTRLAARLVREISGQPRSDAGLSELRIGLKCGRSDPSSGLVANPAVGGYIDRHVAAGGTAIFGEVVEWLGAEHLLAERAADDDIARQLLELPRDREARAVQAGLDLLGNNPSPTNIRSGISTIEEKSLGGISKTGSQPVSGVLAYGEAPARPGLFAMDTPNYAPEHLTALSAAGCQLHLFTTGAGNSFTSGLCPTLKISANDAVCAQLTEQIDIPLDGVMSGRRSMEEATGQIYDSVRQTADGKLSWGEILNEGDDIVSRFDAAL
ncbi:MAG: UxaA family hydrolase [Rhodospirillales bacterium]